MSPRRYRWPAILLLALHLQACSTWRPSPLPLSQVVAEAPGSIRITTEGGETRTLEDPRLVGDSLTTAKALAYCPRDRPEPCQITEIDGESVAATPLDEITSVEVRKLSVGWTVRGIVLTTVGVMALLLVASCAGSDSDFFCE